MKILISMFESFCFHNPNFNKNEFVALMWIEINKRRQALKFDRDLRVVLLEEYSDVLKKTSRQTKTI